MVDPFVLAGLVLGVIGGVSSAVAFYVKLSERVKQLEKEITNNPIFNILKHFETDFLIKEISNFLAKRLEKKDG